MTSPVEQCPKCRTSALRIMRGKYSSASGAGRVECVKCGRFIRWEAAEKKEIDENRAATRDVASATPNVASPAGDSPAHSGQPLPTPDYWPYVSRRLDVVYYPHPGPAALYSAPVVLVGPTGSPGTAFYRLTPAVLSWLVAAGRVMEAKWDRDGGAYEAGGSVPRADADEYCRVVGELRAWAAKYLAGGGEGGGDVAGVKGELPEVPYIPMEPRR